jgi:branched-chain amino acid transport system permease protein
MTARAANAAGVSFLGVLLVLLPVLLPAVGLNISLGTTVILFALAASSVNILLGFTGLMAFGNAAFFGVGAYGSALFIADVNANLILGLLVGAACATLAAVIVAPFLIRRRGIYFSLLTIAFGQVFYFIAYRWSGVTGGEDGFSMTKPPILGGSTPTLNGASYYYFCLAIFAVLLFVLYRIVRSPFGLTLQGIAQNEARVRYLGINTDRFIFVALVLSGFVAGVGGALYSVSIAFSYPLLMDWHQSGDFVMMVILGGVGTIWGPVLGAAIYAIAQNVLSSFTPAWQIVIGGMFIFCVLVFPKGLLGLGEARRRREVEAAQDPDVAVAPALEVGLLEGRHP